MLLLAAYNGVDGGESEQGDEGPEKGTEGTDNVVECTEEG